MKDAVQMPPSSFLCIKTNGMIFEYLLYTLNTFKKIKTLIFGWQK